MKKRSQVVESKEPDVRETGGKCGVRKSKNRRSVEAYNAYQKGYMKVMRALKSGRAVAWPRGQDGAVGGK